MSKQHPYQKVHLHEQNQVILLSFRFDFYKIFDVNNSNRRSTFDQNVYKVLKGWVIAGTETVHFSVRIPCFQRLFRATLVVTDKEGEGLVVKVQDADYDSKVAFYTEAAKISLK